LKVVVTEEGMNKPKREGVFPQICQNFMQAQYRRCPDRKIYKERYNKKIIPDSKVSKSQPENKTNNETE
jgi:hypothetical protein